MTFDPTLVFKQKNSLVWRAVDDGVVIVSPAGGEVRALNTLGGTIWAMLDGSQSAGAIIAELQATYPAVSEQQLQNDFVTFVESLLSRELVDQLDQNA